MRCEECGGALGIPGGGIRKHLRWNAHRLRADLNAAARAGYGPLPPLARALADEVGMKPASLPARGLRGEPLRSVWRQVAVLHRDELDSLAGEAAERFGARSPTAAALREMVVCVDYARAGEPFVRAYGRLYGEAAAGLNRKYWQPMPGRRATGPRGVAPLAARRPVPPLAPGASRR